MGTVQLSLGRFITVEGGEGAGKSTQIALLAEALARAGIPAIRTREPGGSPGAEEIRRLLVEGAPGRWDALTEALLIMAARRSHLTATVLPALAGGQWVVCDRFADSTMAYQGYAGGVPLADLAAMQRIAAGELAPDLTLILDLPVERGLARATARAGGETRFEQKDRAFHERLRQGFLDIARREPQRCVVIDAAADVETVHRAMIDAVRERLGAKL